MVVNSGCRECAWIVAGRGCTVLDEPDLLEIDGRVECLGFERDFALVKAAEIVAAAEWASMDVVHPTGGAATDE